MRSYCSGVEATVIITSASSSAVGSWSVSFDGANISHLFEVSSDVPSHAKAYLLSGFWDNNGNIGTFSASGRQPRINPGDNYEYLGEPVLVGSGSPIRGSVIENGEDINNEATSSGTIQWRWDEEKIELPVSRNRTPISYVVNSGIVNILDKNGAAIFTRRFANPQINIICGDDCPSGHLKCCSNNYPGYCCVPCKEVSSNLKAIISVIKTLK